MSKLSFGFMYLVSTGITRCVDIECFELFFDCNELPPDESDIKLVQTRGGILKKVC